MLYPLAITIVAGVLLLALAGIAFSVARQAAAGGGWRIGSWRWLPSPLALLILIPLLGLVLWRFFPELLFIPLILPFFWRRGRMRSPLFAWTRRRSPRGRKQGGSIDADYRPLDDD